MSLSGLQKQTYKGEHQCQQREEDNSRNKDKVILEVDSTTIIHKEEIEIKRLLHGLHIRRKQTMDEKHLLNELIKQPKEVNTIKVYKETYMDGVWQQTILKEGWTVTDYDFLTNELTLKRTSTWMNI